jgi:hypothetical protein
MGTPGRSRKIGHRPGAGFTGTMRVSDAVFWKLRGIMVPFAFFREGRRNVCAKSYATAASSGWSKWPALSDVRSIISRVCHTYAFFRRSRPRHDSRAASWMAASMSQLCFPVVAPAPPHVTPTLACTTISARRRISA